MTALRYSRLIAWGRMMLMWLSAMLFMDVRAKRRHIRNRYGLLDPNRFARYVGNLIYIRAGALHPNTATRRLHHPRGGARAKARVESPLRAVRGSALRKLLRHPDLRTRFSIFVYALDHIDDFARALGPRLTRRFTRLRPILMAPVAAEAVVILAGPAPHTADSS